MKKQLKKVGITGGIGAGKSTVCNLFAQKGYEIYYADERAKIVMTDAEDLKASIITHFGLESYTQDGALNRSYLAQKVFGDETLLKLLNSLVHPVVIRDFQYWFQNIQTDKSFILKEAALIFEAGTNVGLDCVLYVYAPLGLRIERVMQRDQVSQAAVEGRIARQWTDEKKIALSNFVIYNDNSRELMPQIEEAIQFIENITTSLQPEI